MTTMPRPLHAARSSRGLALAVSAVCAVVGLIGVSPVLGWIGPAAADSGSSTNSGNTGSGNSAAVVTPLLDMFSFGNTIGLPLACSDAGSVVSIVGAQTNSSQSVSPLVGQLDSQCSQLASEGEGYLQQAIAESQGLTMINPLADPLIGEVATGLTTLGTQYGSSLAPFGPTVAGLGGTVAFFEGS